jgi:hypothetical protein
LVGRRGGAAAAADGFQTTLPAEREGRAVGSCVLSSVAVGLFNGAQRLTD